jgi:hypothetical protein
MAERAHLPAYPPSGNRQREEIDPVQPAKRRTLRTITKGYESHTCCLATAVRRSALCTKPNERVKVDTRTLPLGPPEYSKGSPRKTYRLQAGRGALGYAAGKSYG